MRRLMQPRGRREARAVVVYHVLVPYMLWRGAFGIWSDLWRQVGWSRDVSCSLLYNIEFNINFR